MFIMNKEQQLIVLNKALETEYEKNTRSAGRLIVCYRSVNRETSDVKREIPLSLFIFHFSPFTFLD